MYFFFLANLLYPRVCYTPNILLVDLLQENRVISMVGCNIHLYFFRGLGSTECYLLAVILYGRYLTICQLLHYTILMQETICVGPLIVSWVTVFTVAAMFQATIVFSLIFCCGNEIDYFCDLKPLQKLSCSDPYLVNPICISLTALVTLTPFWLTLASYWRIFFHSIT